MIYKINEDYIFSKKDNILKVTSILPNQNEIFHFSGEVVDILELSFKRKELNREFLTKDLNKNISDEDWNGLIKFLLDKNIIKE